MTTSVAALILIALVASATLIGLVWRSRQGRVIRNPSDGSIPDGTGYAGTGPTSTGPTSTGPTSTGLIDAGPTSTGSTSTGSIDAEQTDVVPAQRGPVMHPEFGLLGERGTFVQMSTEICANCPSVRRSLTSISESEPGVVFVEVDVGRNLDIASQHDIRRTPTVLLLNAAGRQIARVNGPARADRYRALAEELPPSQATAHLTEGEPE